MHMYTVIFECPPNTPPPSYKVPRTLQKNNSLDQTPSAAHIVKGRQFVFAPHASSADTQLSQFSVKNYITFNQRPINAIVKHWHCSRKESEKRDLGTNGES